MAGDDFELNQAVSHTLFDPTASPYVQLGSTFTSSAVDSNGDSRFDALHVAVSATNLRPDTAMIAIDAMLLGPSGQLVTTGHGESVAPPGVAAPLDLRFDGQAIAVSGTSGPYTVAQVMAASDLDSLRSFGRLVYLAQAHTTAPYSFLQFAPAPHVFGLIEDDGVPVPDASVRMVVAGAPAIPDSSGRYHLGTPDLLPGTYSVSMSLPAGYDTTGWRVLKNGQDSAPGRSAVVTFDSTEAVRLDFVQGLALSVPTEAMAAGLLTVWHSAPNPARGGTPIRFSYTLAQAATVEVTVFDINGRRLVGPLVHAGGSGAGVIEVPAGGAGKPHLAPGVYLVRIAARAADGVSGSWKGRLVVLN